jgi:hypothetical protein
LPEKGLPLSRVAAFVQFYNSLREKSRIPEWPAEFNAVQHSARLVTDGKMLPLYKALSVFR